MSKLFRKIALRLGWKTTYHVAATYQQDSHMSTSLISMTVTISPWLHADNYADLMAYVKTQAVRPTVMPGITSITKLGL